MDLINSIKKDKAYIKSKLIVKTWEKEFKAKHARIPSKFDIKEAPAKIKYAYKKYFQLKSSALENSLSVIEFEDDDNFVTSPNSGPLVDTINSITFNDASSPSSDQLLQDLPTGQELEKLLQAPKVVPVPKFLPAKNVEINHPFTENLSKKLFQNRKFTLRNPRKLSLPREQSMNETSSQDDSQSSQGNSEGSKLNLNSTNCDTDENMTIPFFTNPLENIKSQSVRQINTAWMERAAGLTQSQTTQFDDNADTPHKFGLGNITLPVLTQTQSKVTVNNEININSESKPCDYVENSESEGEYIEKIKPALKKRKIDEVTVAISEKGSENKITKPSRKKVQSLKTKKKQNGPLKSKKVEDPIVADIEPPDIKEYVPFGIEKDLVPRHAEISNVLKSINGPNNIDSKNIQTNHNTEKLEQKIKNGTLNENFVRINIEKKVFVRGKKNINFSKYKKQQWKNKKALHGGMEFPEAGKISCFKCGGSGHMARYCAAHKGETLLPLDNCTDNDEMPTLDDMNKLFSQEYEEEKSVTEQLSETLFEPTQIPDSFLKLLGDTDCNGELKPLYSSLDSVDSNILNEALQKFGHTNFQSGQESAIKRILCGLSTLLILSTGGGKSLCYQLPAYLYSKYNKCITLVISPLVSLMEDQVINMPEFLRAGCLHTNQPPTQRRKIIQCLKDGEINILLISPEALISGDNSSGFAGLFKSLPPIAFACIDEAHCVSHWSHNFRPSYLMICRVLREKLNVKCILGLTATATQTTIKSMISHINIPDDLDGVITNPTLPDNLLLSVSFEKDKDRALISYLMSERICNFRSIIVYCIRRDECERVAAVLRSCLQETGKVNMETNTKKRKRMSYIAEAYHAGMSAAQRKKIQKHFMDGTLRVIVATVAFGMGINKADIRCIIHYNMPSSFESYVQEVGRAGRDSLPAECHVFINNSSNDINELLKHIYANSIDRPTIRKLLSKVFVPCDCVKSEETSTTNQKNCKGHEVGIPIDTTVEELDVPSENIATLLCYVELHEKKYIKVLNNAYIMCKISSYGGPQKILEAAKTCRPLAMAYLMESKKDPDLLKNSVFEFNVIEVAAAIGWESGMTKYHLKNLEWITENGSSKRSFLKVEFNTLGFRIKARGDLTSSQLDNILDELHETVLFQEKAKLYQLEECSRAFKTLGNYSIESCNLSYEDLLEKSNQLKSIIRNYFERDNCFPNHIKLEERPLDAERAINDIKALVYAYKDCNFTGRSIAKIFQGISSPNYPAIVWGKCKFWRAHLHEDFTGLLKLATQQLIQMK